MHRTGSLAFILALSIGLAACGGGGGSKATPQPTSTPTPQPIPPVAGEPTVTASGLKIIDTLVGTGTEAKTGDSVTVQYTGFLEDGTIFDGPLIHGIGSVSFSLSRVILGWQEGVPGMKAGGMRRLIIPPALAYGDKANGQIPPNATLTFDIELLSVP